MLNRRKEIRRLTADCARKDIALRICRQALMEVAHAQQCGPAWYTKGEGGLYSQVRMWVDRGAKAIRDELDE